jgi:hypothetical protein
MKRLIAFLLACAAAQAFSIDDWRLAYRSAVVADVVQTQWLKSHGWHEENPVLRELGDLPTALLQVGSGELVVWLCDRLPRSLRHLAGYAALLLRVRPVLSNSRHGVPFRVQLPLLQIRFRS